MFRLLLFFLVALPIFAQNAAKSAQIASPNGNVQLKVNHLADGKISYQVKYKGKMILEPSKFSFALNQPKVLLQRFDWTKTDSSMTNETWKPVWGEVAEIRNHYKELKLSLKSRGQNRGTSGILLNVVFRVFNEGIGFRYEFPEQNDLKHFILGDERTEFNLTADHKTFWIPGDYDTNEYLYNTTKLSQVHAIAAAAKDPDIAVKSIIADNAVQTPLMMKTANGLYLNLHEAALTNYPAMNLLVDKTTFTLTSQLVPDAVGNKAYLQTPCQTPWRVLNVSDDAREILASKMILNLNEPSKIGDTSWIKPQKFMGVWWEMHVNKGTWEMASGKHAATTANVKRYLDFAAKHGFDGVLVEGWNTGWEDWFGKWKEDVFDFVTPYPDYDLPLLADYAKQKGIKLIMHHETSGAVTSYELQMDRAFALMKKYGMNAVKTGYVGKIIPRGEHHDGQWMVKHYERVAKRAAESQIMVAAHEPVRPTGQHRTYPNWLANEAARGNEFNNAPTLGMSPEHQTILPFTRLMGGPMDFTPGMFQFKLNQYDKSRTTEIRTTLAKQLALYITMYSPLQMAGDLPENYEKHLDAFQFIKDVPVDWQDTRILEAEPGDFITIARKDKHSQNWYIGGITDEYGRTSLLSLRFLDANATYEATIYRDGENADWKTNPASYIIEKKTLTANDTLTLKLATSGGFAIRLVRK